MSASPQLIPATGNDILRMAQERIGQKYVLGVTVPKNDARWPVSFSTSKHGSSLSCGHSFEVQTCT